MSSLQDQLLKAGLVDQKQAKKAVKDKRKSEKVQRKSGEAPVDETKQRVQQAKVDKAERDKLLNQQHRQDAEHKAIAAQIKQLVETNRQPKGDTSYNFRDGKKIKKIFVEDLLSRQLARGLFAIVKIDGDYAVVPRVVAEKISQRDQSYVILCNQPQQSQQDDDEDPYADYKIPDDLMW